MGDAALILGSLASVVLVPAACLLLGARARSRGLRLSVLAPFEEIYDPVAHRATIEIHVQGERLTPAPAPGDPPSDDGPGSPAR